MNGTVAGWGGLPTARRRTFRIMVRTDFPYVIKARCARGRRAPAANANRPMTWALAPVTQGTPAGNRPQDGRPFSTRRNHKAHEHETPHQDHKTRATQRSRERSKGPRAAHARRRRSVATAPPLCLRHRPRTAARPSPPAAAKNQHRAIRYRGLPHHHVNDALGYRRGRIAAAVPRGLPRYRGRCPVAGAVGSATVASHFGASLEDHGPNVVL